MLFLHKIRGFFLIEVLLTLLIITILYLALRPNWHYLAQTTNARYLLAQLLAALTLARQTAMMHGSAVVMCLSNDSQTCERQAHDTLLIFRAALLHSNANNNDAFIVTPQYLIKVLPLLSKQDSGVLRWRSFPKSQPWLSFRATGASNVQNGTFWYCAQPQQPPAWAVAVSQAGRWRVINSAKLEMLAQHLPC